VGEAGVDAELAERQVPLEARRALLELVAGGATLPRVQSFLAGHAQGEQALGELSSFLDLSSETAAAAHVRFDVSLARGLGYYTGCIFELATPKFGGSLGGGGRYDGLIGLFLGRQVPACGFALGFERLLLLMEEGGMFPENLSGLDVVLGMTGEADGAALLAMSRGLRGAGLRVAMTPKAEKAMRLRKAAEDRGAAFALWLEGGAWQLWQRHGDSTQRALPDADSVLALLKERAR
jgi:histidyl-tRNA synthetase